jgi:hypothetical protein
MNVEINVLKEKMEVYVKTVGIDSP